MRGGPEEDGASGSRMGLGLLLGMGCLVVGMASLATGPMSTGVFEVARVLAERLSFGLAGWEINERLAVVVLEIRLPRMLLAGVVGAGLATAGACLQGLFRNPLADPGLIGVSSGGANGGIAAISTVGWLPMSTGLLADLYIPLVSILGALGTTLAVYRVARIAGKTHVSTLLLAGIAVNALAGALVGAVLYLSDNDALRRFTFWTLGSLHTTTWRSLLLMLPFIVAPLALLPRMRPALNAFLLGEAEAYHLGFDTQRVKRVVIVLCALMVGSTVAFCGLIGFVGLVVPHLVRMLRGPDFRYLIPYSALLGALLVMLADLMARTVNAPAEVPIGVVTSLVGAPFFLYLIQRRKRQLAV